MRLTLDGPLFPSRLAALRFRLRWAPKRLRYRAGRLAAWARTSGPTVLRAVAHQGARLRFRRVPRLGGRVVIRLCP